MLMLRRLNPRNWMVATRLFAGFGLSVAFTVCACLVAWANFMQSERAMRTIELETISGMVNALEMASEQSALSALAPDLSRVVSDVERGSIAHRLDEQIAKIQSRLDSFRNHPYDDDLEATIGRVHLSGVRNHREPSLAEAQALATVSAAGSTFRGCPILAIASRGM